MRIPFLAVCLTLAVAAPCFAHAVVDLGVRFVAPEFVPSSSNVPIDVVVDGLAFDSAFGVTVDIHIADAKVTSSDPSWRCTTSSTLVECSAEELKAGPHPVHLDVKVPAGGSLHASATVASLGSFDPVDANNDAALDSRVFNRSQCQQTAPQIAGDFQWTPSAGATVYEVYSGLDGETPHFAARTTETHANIAMPGGQVTWFVRARFDSCPALDSANGAFESHAAPVKFAVATVSHGELTAPQSAAVFGDTVYVSDPVAKRAFTLSPSAPNLAPLQIYGDIVSSPPLFNGGIATGPGGYLYDADSGTHSVRFVDYTHYMYFAAGQPNSGGTVDGHGVQARFDSPTAVVVDDVGTFYVTDAVSNVIRKMVYDSTKFDFIVTTMPGHFSEPAGITIDPSGNVFFAERGNHVIRKLASDGSVTTLAGSPGVNGHADGDVASALFNRPSGIAADPWGNLYVTEEGNHDIRKIAPNGRVTTVAGDPAIAGSSEGAGSAALFERPGLLAVAPDGTLWIPDTANGRLLHAAASTGERRRAAKH
ncbi:MAG TPA: hypothetical protein VF980_07095 [Thermoanaerobaculia bacterium]